MHNCSASRLAAGLLVLTASACAFDVHGAGVVTKDEKRFTVDGTPEITLSTFDGDIDVRASDQKDVVVEIQRRGVDAAAANALVVNVKQDGDRITVEAVDPGRHNGGIHVGWNISGVRLIVTTPKNALIETRSGDGAITIRGIDGRIKARTGDGSIRIEDAAGSVAADTGDGAVDVSGRLDGLSVNTGDGSIRVRIDDGSVMSGDWRIETHDGAIDVRVPAAFNADLEAHTGDGSVRADGVVNQAREDRHGRRDVTGRLGSGGRTLRVRSGDGSIIITR